MRPHGKGVKAHVDSVVDGRRIDARGQASEGCARIGEQIVLGQCNLEDLRLDPAQAADRLAVEDYRVIACSVDIVRIEAAIQRCRQRRGILSARGWVLEYDSVDDGHVKRRVSGYYD